jgi:hypothetical protein
LEDQLFISLRAFFDMSLGDKAAGVVIFALGYSVIKTMGIDVHMSLFSARSAT